MPILWGKAVLLCVPGCFKSGLSSSGWVVKCLNGCANQMPHISDHDAKEAWNRRVDQYGCSNIKSKDKI
jgi:hypothetical protein